MKKLESFSFDPNKKTILILATGGTIAGSGESGKQTGYKSGALSAEELIATVPKIKEIANIKAEQLYNLNSDDITGDQWLVMANKINNLEKDDSVDGIVVTHGTDTMEETSYFMNLVCKTTKPVVFTGSMRPATSLSADGPMNLYQAVLVAACDEAKNKPVMAVMNDTIMSARAFQKTSTSSLDTMKSASLGELGVVRDNNVVFTNVGRETLCTVESEFDISQTTTLPRVNIVYFSVDADTEMLAHAIIISDGVVIAGAGAGEYSQSWKNIIDLAPIPVVISTRTSTGFILQDSLLSKNTVASSYLNPQKAAVLLKCALLNNKERTQDDLIRIFNSY